MYKYSSMSHIYPFINEMKNGCYTLGFLDSRKMEEMFVPLQLVVHTVQ